GERLRLLRDVPQARLAGVVQAQGRRAEQPRLAGLRLQQAQQAADQAALAGAVAADQAKHLALRQVQGDAAQHLVAAVCEVQVTRGQRDFQIKRGYGRQGQSGHVGSSSSSWRSRASTRSTGSSSSRLWRAASRRAGSSWCMRVATLPVAGALAATTMPLPRSRSSTPSASSWL